MRTEIEVDADLAALSARVIRTVTEWKALAPFWDQLLENSTDSTPWQSWSYLGNWWRHIPTRMSLFVIVVESADKPCLIMPLQLTRSRLLGLSTLTLEPIGMWSDVNRPRLALGPDNVAYYDCAFDLLWQLRREWELLRIDEKLLDDPEVGHLRRFCITRGLLFRNIFSHLCPYLNLQQSWDAFLKDRGQKMRKNLRASHRRLAAHGCVSLRDCRSPDEISEGFNTVLMLHHRSWKHRKRVEHSNSPGYEKFYRRWLTDMAAAGRARILILICDSQPVAATVAFMQGSTYFSSQIVHDEDFSHCSPGTLLESMEIEGLMKTGEFEHYDFLGSFLNNKLRWTSTARATSVVYALQNTFKNRLVAGYYFSAKPRIKRIYAQLRDFFSKIAHSGR